MLIFSAALEQLPESVIEAARIDGASGFRSVERRSR
jgi:multiple sugar transport system permease protein